MKPRIAASTVIMEGVKVAEQTGATITVFVGKTKVEITPPQNPTPPNPADLVQM